MPTQFTLQKVLDEIAKNKAKLEHRLPEEKPEQEVLATEKVIKVEEFFNQKDLEKRRAELEDAEALESRRQGFASATLPKPETPPDETVRLVDEFDYPRYTPLEDLPPDVKQELKEEKEKYEFRSVFDLKDFILMFRDTFEDAQKAALDSIVAVCDTIEVGCNCKKGSRLRIAEDYYVQFINQNQGSGLIEKLKETLNTKRIKFYSKEKLFLER